MHQDPDQVGAAREHNPYTPPADESWSDTKIARGSLDDPGTYWGGFAMGLFFAVLGLAIAHLRGKPETKTGSLHGFGARIGLIVVVLFLNSLLR